MVVYNESTGNSSNILKLKKELVDVFIGDKLRNVPPVQEEVEHSLVRGEAWMKCVYSDMFSQMIKRTRFYCANPDCMLPLVCHINLDKDSLDCFAALAHAD
jgi:hypothetical protein